MQLINCDWFLKSVLDSSIPDYDFEKSLRNPPRKIKDTEECFDEDNNMRALGKYNAGTTYSPDMFPSAYFSFFRTPFTNELDPEGLIYWIANTRRTYECPDNSFLAYNNGECETGETHIALEQLGNVGKTFW